MKFQRRFIEGLHHSPGMRRAWKARAGMMWGGCRCCCRGFVSANVVVAVIVVVVVFVVVIVVVVFVVKCC